MPDGDLTSIDITFYEGFVKQPNATTIPAANWPHRTFNNCFMWSGVSIMAPVVELTLMTMQGNIPKFDNPAQLGMTYCYIPAFQRYYWVLDWQLIESRWVCTLQVDVLASFKDDIGRTYMFANRLGDRLDWVSVNGVMQLRPVDTGLPDSTLPTVSRPHLYKQNYSLNFIWSQNNLGGTFVIGLVNPQLENNVSGAVSYIVMTQSQLRKFMHYLLSDVTYGNITDMSDDARKAILNPMQYIVSCKYFAMDINLLSSDPELEGPQFGWWRMSTEVKFKRKTGRLVRIFSRCLRLQDHPYADNLNMSCLNYEPYTTYHLQMPFIGAYDLDRRDCPSGKLTVSYAIDTINGNCSAYLFNGWPLVYDPTQDNYDQITLPELQAECPLIQILEGVFAVDVPLAQTASDYQAATMYQTQARSVAQEQSAMLQMSYSSAMSSAILNTAGAIASALTLNAGGFIGGLQAAAASRQEAYNVSKYGGAAASARARAAAASGSYSATVARAPKISYLHAQGSWLDSVGDIALMTLVGEYMIPSTITGHNYNAPAGAGDTTSTEDFLTQWAGYAHGRFITVNEHSGYIQGNSPRFESNRALQPEIDQIKDYLVNGFFYV